MFTLLIVYLLLVVPSHTKWCWYDSKGMGLLVQPDMGWVGTTHVWWHNNPMPVSGRKEQKRIRSKI